MKIYMSYLNTRKNLLETFAFDTISEAYLYYVRHYATLGERWYYWRCAKTRLSKVTDEDVMTAIFRNVFTNGNIYPAKG